MKCERLMHKNFAFYTPPA